MIEYRESVPTVEAYLALRRSAGWHALSRAAVATALDNSLFSVCARSGGELVGCGRVVGDGGVYFYVQDVLVHPRWRGQGIASQIMERLMRRIDDHAGPGALIGLMAAPGLERFYSRYGFSLFTPDCIGMLIWKK